MSRSVRSSVKSRARVEAGGTGVQGSFSTGWLGEALSRDLMKMETSHVSVWGQRPRQSDRQRCPSGPAGRPAPRAEMPSETPPRLPLNICSKYRKKGLERPPFTPGLSFCYREERGRPVDRTPAAQPAGPGLWLPDPLRAIHLGTASGLEAETQLNVCSIILLPWKVLTTCHRSPVEGMASSRSSQQSGLEGGLGPRLE